MAKYLNLKNFINFLAISSCYVLLQVEHKLFHELHLKWHVLPLNSKMEVYDPSDACITYQ